MVGPLAAEHPSAGWRLLGVRGACPPSSCPPTLNSCTRLLVLVWRLHSLTLGTEWNLLAKRLAFVVSSLNWHCHTETAQVKCYGAFPILSYLSGTTPIRCYLTRGCLSQTTVRAVLDNLQNWDCCAFGAGVAVVLDVPAAVCERRAATGEAGQGALGQRDRLPGLPPLHLPAVPHPKVSGQPSHPQASDQ